METRKYSISKWHILCNYFSIPIYFASAFFIFLSIASWPPESPFLFMSMVIFFVFFLAGGVYSIKIVPEMKDSIHISENQIMRENSAEGTFTTIWWKENFTVRNRKFLGRLELISQDGQRVVKIEHQTERFQEICNLVYAKWIEKQGKMR
jgi:hypothetical protein